MAVPENAMRQLNRKKTLLGGQDSARGKSLLEKLQGFKDSRGPVGQLSRGNNVYNGASSAAQSGGGMQFGRPPEQTQQRPAAAVIPSDQRAQQPEQANPQDAVNAAKQAMLRRFGQQGQAMSQQNQQQRLQMDQSKMMDQQNTDKMATKTRQAEIMNRLRKVQGGAAR